MVKAVVLHGLPEDPDAFERCYAETHAALAKAIPGLQRFEAAQGIATPDGSAVPDGLARSRVEVVVMLPGGAGHVVDQLVHDWLDRAQGNQEQLRAPSKMPGRCGRSTRDWHQRSSGKVTLLK